MKLKILNPYKWPEPACVWNIRVAPPPPPSWAACLVLRGKLLITTTEFGGIFVASYMHCRQQRNRLPSILHVRIQTVFVRWSPTITAFSFACFWMMTRGRIQILLKAGHRRSASETPFEWRQMAFRWRGDAVGPSLNARMVTVIFQGIRTIAAEKPYIFVIFQGGGASGSADVLWRRIVWCPSIFYCCSHCIRGLPDYVVLSRR